jgi:hypothetical protein
VAAFGAAVLAGGRPAHADNEELRSVRDDSSVTHGMAEFGVGLLTLPAAEVCQASCTRGDTSFAVTAWPMFRRGNFAAGAGVTLGLTSSTDAPRNDPPDIPRDHTRRYFTVEVTGRYYVPITDALDAWVGVTSGLVVVNDIFESQKGLTEQARIGPRGIEILTEGYTLGAGAGLGSRIAENWLLGGGVRVADWFLPKTPARDPISDEASLRGVVTTLEISLTLAYRSTLVF